MAFPFHEDADFFREAVNYTAAETGFLPRLIEKDYFCTVLLSYFTAADSSLVFKGGTCLSKTYGDFYRLSEDVDFVISIAPGSSRAVRRDRAIPKVRWPKEEKKVLRFSVEVMGLVRRDEPEEIRHALDAYRVPVQACMNGQQSLDAVNRLIPIIREKFQPSESVLKGLNWALWELIDNAAIHGYQIMAHLGPQGRQYPAPVYFCAFAFDDFIEIAIADCGQGIMSRFHSSEIGRYKNLSNEEALQMAIKLHESANPDEGMGFGLYGCAELARRSAGKLVIISGGHRLTVDQEGVTTTSCYPYQGTLVILRFPEQAKVNLEAIFQRESAIMTMDIDDLVGGFGG